MLIQGITRIAVIAGLALAATLPALATRADDAGQGQGTQIATPDTQSNQDEALDQRRKRVVVDATAALRATRQAIEALEQGDTEEALSQLEVATGKIDLLVSRHPGAAVLPVDVSVSQVDVVASNQAIEELIERAEEALEDGRVQHARRILDPLGSELVFVTTELPLAAYPAAMRLAAPLIEEGKVEEARAALVAAIDTLIVREEVVPLPVLRAEILIAAAEKKLDEPPVIDAADPEKPSESAEEDELTPKELLTAARAHLERATILGYGEAKKTYPVLVERLEKLEKDMGDEPSKGWRNRLAKLRASLEEYGSSLLE